MALPEDFNKIYGSTATGGLTPINDVNYAKGWEFVGPNPPTKNDFSYLQNLSDLKSKWLYLNKLQRSNPFGDIKSDGTVKKALENLGLGTAAQKDVGNSANQIPDMSYFTTGQTSAGRWAKLPSGLIIQAGTGITSPLGTASVNLPIPFTGTFFVVGGSIEGNGPVFVSARPVTQSTIGIVAWGRDGSIQVTNMHWLAIGV